MDNVGFSLHHPPGLTGGGLKSDTFREVQRHWYWHWSFPFRVTDAAQSQRVAEIETKQCVSSYTMRSAVGFTKNIDPFTCADRERQVA